MKLKVLLVSLMMVFSGWFVPAEASQVYEHRIQYNINKIKRSHGLSTVSLGSCSDSLSETWARHLRNTGTFQHRNIFQTARICGRPAGEIMARGYRKPINAVKAWMRSPSHRRILLDGNYNRVGVGAVDSKDGMIVVVDFSRR